MVQQSDMELLQHQMDPNMLENTDTFLLDTSSDAKSSSLNSSDNITKKGIFFREILTGIFGIRNRGLLL